MEYIKHPTSKHLGAELDKKKIRGIYLFIGEEEGDKEKYIRRIADTVFSGREEAETYTGWYHIEMDEFMKAAGFALSVSMFSDRKVCVMMNIESLHATPANISLLNEIITALPESVLLIMTSSENRVPKFIGKDLLGRIGVYHFWRPFEKDLLPYIIGELKKSGIDIDREAASLLLEITGRDVKRIDESLEKIRNFIVQGELSGNAVRYVINEEREISHFEFIDSLFKKQKKSLDLLKKLIENNFPELLILNQVVRQAEQIERYYGMVKNGLGGAEALEEAGVPAKYKNDFLEYIHKNSYDEIRAMFARIHRADYALKSSRTVKSVISNPLFDLATGILF